jgi:hypothetical protein
VQAPLTLIVVAICTPTSLSQEVELGLGAQAGEARLRETVYDAGFSRFRRATETPFNLVLEARRSLGGSGYSTRCPVNAPGFVMPAEAEI